MHGALGATQGTEHPQAVTPRAHEAGAAQPREVPRGRGLRHADYVQFDLAQPPLNLTLVPSSAATTGELDHLGLQVRTDEALRAARARLAAAGLRPQDEHEVECCDSRQDKFWVRDPEGRQVEIFRRLADVERPDAGRSAGAPDSPCCEPSGCTPE